jgi:hypothetical protein
MLGSLSEADDAVQEAWLRASRSDTNGVENLGGWLTTVVARVCLDALQRRQSRREEPLDAGVPPLAVLSDEEGTDWDRPEFHGPALAGADAAFVVMPELVEDPSPVTGPFFDIAREWACGGWSCCRRSASSSARSKGSSRGSASATCWTGAAGPAVTSCASPSSPGSSAPTTGAAAKPRSDA